MSKPVILGGSLRGDSLAGMVVLVTGAGRGIGYEAARSLLHLGANVVMAEINEESGMNAAKVLSEQFGAGRVIFVKTDVGDEGNVSALRVAAEEAFGNVDAVINNATIFPMGAVVDREIGDWDKSYRVNLRGPVLLARAFLPKMLGRGRGIFVCVSSSGAAPYMGAYEVFKTAQGELASTIAGEVEGKGVYAYTIGPGIVKTPGFADGGAQVARLMGITPEQLFDMNKAVQLSAEEAGAGFAASLALAEKYHGQEVSSIQALNDIGVRLGEAEQQAKTADYAEASAVGERILKTFEEQAEGWRRRNIFERQWVQRDFKKYTGLSSDDMGALLRKLNEGFRRGTTPPGSAEALRKLEAYWIHQQELLKGYERNAERLAENMRLMDGWVADIRELVKLLS